MKYPERNIKAMLSQEAIIEKLGYGFLDITTEFHNRKITKQTFYGKERKKYGAHPDSQKQATNDIIKRLAKSLAGKETTKLKFQIDVRNGNVEQVVWLSEIDVVYQD